MNKLAARERLVVALDVPSVEEARALVAALGDAVVFYKVGLELLFSGGLAFAGELKRQGKRVFLDVKLLDIGNTVERAVANVAALGVDLVTIHGSDSKTLRAAVTGRGQSALKLLAVTVLTNLSASDLSEGGIKLSPGELVLRRAGMAKDAGFDGIVASGLEAARIRAAVGPNMLVVTPGIRLAGGEAGDQERVTTPGQAIAAGADLIVVGRPITRARQPEEAAESFVREIEIAIDR
jgi:orotidine-5'-phosphate decarboxylase